MRGPCTYGVSIDNNLTITNPADAYASPLGGNNGFYGNQSGGFRQPWTLRHVALHRRGGTPRSGTGLSGA